MSEETEKHHKRSLSGGSGQHGSQIPILSPKRFSRAGSLKLRGENRPQIRNTNHRKDECSSNSFSSSTPVSTNLKRYRSLQAFTPAGRMMIEKDDDLDSDRSLGSSCSSLCGGGHAPFAHNGTTYSARNMRYIFHCTPNTGSEEYLTPTQRANRTIKRLRQMLADTQSELIEKENEINKLTKEVVELKLLQVNKGNRSDEMDYSDSIDLDEYNNKQVNNNMNMSNTRYMEVVHEESDVLGANNTCMEIINDNSNSGSTINIRPDERGLSPHLNPNSPSLADSGHFEDINYVYSHTILEKEYEKLKQTYDEMREKHNEKVEHLLKIIADSNDRYYELRPKFDTTELKLKQLEKENEELKLKLLSLENWKKENEELQFKLLSIENSSKELLETNTKEQEEKCDVQNPKTNEIGVEENSNSLQDKLNMTQLELDNLKNIDYKGLSLLTATEAISLWILATRKALHKALQESNNKPDNDAEMTLRFLKTAVYYFLTDQNNKKDHLSAIQSILGYSTEEKAQIEKALQYILY